MQQSRFRPQVRIRRTTTLVALIFLSLVFVSCGGKHVGAPLAAPRQGRASTAPTLVPAYTRYDEAQGIKVADGVEGSFVVFAVDGRERLIPDAKRLYAASASVGAGGAITLTVTNSQQQTLSQGFFYIKYDATRLSPMSCTFGDGIVGRQMLTLALTDQQDVVPAGFAGIHGATVSLAAGQPVLTATFANRPFAQTKKTSSVPTGSENRVQDWRVTTNPDNTVTYEWTQRLVGDYNSDGEVGITDLVPLAALYGDLTTDNQVNATAVSWTNGQLLRSRDDELGPLRWAYDAWDKIADGDGSKEVGIGDLQPLANHYGQTILGYDAYFNGVKLGQADPAPSIAMPATLGTAIPVANPDLPRIYTLTFNPGTGLSAIRKRPSLAPGLQNGLAPVGDQGIGDPSTWVNHLVVITAYIYSGTRQVDYTLTVNPVPNSYLWDFGDGATSTEQNPSHTFAQDGDYFVTITMTDAAGQFKYVLPKLSFSADAPWAPTGLGGTVPPTPPYDVTLNWTASADPSVAYYNVYYSPTANNPYPARYDPPAPITTTGATITDAEVPGAQYMFWRVTAVKTVAGGKQESDYSNEWHNTQTTDTMPPVWQGAPGLQSATAGNGKVTLAWGTAVDAQSMPVTYNVYYTSGASINFTSPGGTEATTIKLADKTSPYDVSSLANGTPYLFAVRAQDSAALPNEDANTVTHSATPHQPIVSGAVTLSGGGGLSGVTMTLSPGGMADLTQADGSFAILDVPDGTYTLTPTKAGYTFSPPPPQVIVSGADVPGQDFTATPLASVSGAVTLSGGGGLSGVTMTLTPGGLDSITQADGTYTIAAVSSGNYTLTPSKSGYWFAPPNKSVPMSGLNVTGQDFSGTLSGLANTPWPKFRGNPTNTGLSSHIGAQASALKWAFTTSVWVRSSPAVGADGTVYVGSADGNLYALNPADGTVKWSHATGNYVQSSPAVGVDGTVYFGSDNNNVYALNAADGSEKWTRSVGAEVYSSPAIGADGTVYVGSGDHKVYALNPSDGSIKWSHTTGGFILSSPAIGADGTIYIGSDDNSVYALNPLDGSVKWSHATDNWVESSPSVGADGTVYVGGRDGKVYALNAFNGSLKWAHPIGNSMYSSPAIGSDGTVYIGSQDSNVYALSPVDGSVKWSHPTSGNVDSSPAIGADGTVYVGSYDHNVYALRPSDGSVKWSYATGGWVYSSPAIGADGTIYVGSYDGKIYALNDGLAKSAWPKFHGNARNTGLSSYVGAQTNAVKWTRLTGGAVESSPAVGADGTVYVGSDDHNVYALSPSDGSVKWSHTTGGAVSGSPAISADGTVYVGSYDHNVYALDPLDGSVKWACTAGAEVNSSPAIGADGTVYVGCWDGKVYALNPSDGSIEWLCVTGNKVDGSSPAIGADGTVYVGSCDHKVYALSPSDGGVKWSYATGNIVSSSPAIGVDGTIYVGSHDAEVYALTANGGLKWSTTTGALVLYSSPALGADGTVYIGSSDVNVYALNPADGSVKWSYATGGAVFSSPTVGANGLVYVGSYDNKVYALYPADGSVKWTYVTGNVVTSSPAVGADGTLYVGSYDGKVYAFGP